MKIKFNSVIKYIIVFVISLGIIFMPVKADSGWDSSYDSGGWDSGSSWDSGSDWDYDNDYSWGSSIGDSLGGSGFSVAAIVIAIVFIIIIYVITNNNNKNNRSGGGNTITKSDNYTDTSEEKIISIDPSINIEKFKLNAFNIYKELQTAWMNFDTDTIRKLTTDEVYNMYTSQLETLKIKKQKNIMSDITLEEVKIIDIKKENDVITVNTYMRVKCYDYVIKQDTGETVRGENNQKIIIEYILSFVKSATNNKTEEKCPNCGAPVPINASSTCPYCDSTLVKDASIYVMSKKTCIGQYPDR